VVGFGALAWDRFLVVPWFPRPDEKLRAMHAEECAGGTVATALVALRRWGLQCRAVGTLGDDAYSDRILADLQEEQIDLAGLKREPDAEGRRSTILVDNRTGQRTVISGPHRVPTYPLDYFEPRHLAGARVLHLDTSIGPAATMAAEHAKARGVRVTLDAERVFPGVEKLLAACDHVIASMQFAAELTGADKLSLAAYGVHLRAANAVTVVTDGPRGCECLAGGQQFAVPAYDVPVVDSTGAGDVFHAAYVYGVLAGWEVRKALRFAAWAAAQSCRELGGRKGIPTLDAVREYLRQDNPI
jgi:sulfofructose kinase